MYHVLNRANARMTIFRDDADYEAFRANPAGGGRAHPDAPAGVLSDAQSLASRRLAETGWRAVAVRGRADSDAYAALACLPGLALRAGSIT